MHYTRSVLLLVALQLFAQVDGSPVAQVASSLAATGRPTVTVRVGRCLLTDGLSSTGGLGSMAGSSAVLSPNGASGSLGGSTGGVGPISASGSMVASIVGPSPTSGLGSMGGSAAGQTGATTPSVLQSAVYGS